MLPIDLCDILEFLPSPEKETSFKITGIPVNGEQNDNLVYRAFLLLKDKYAMPGLRIHLHKIIPAGAGLGGGSSDAAFILKGLNNMFDLKLSVNELMRLAATLGSDCSFFIKNEPSFAKGKGEILEPSENFLKDFKILLFFPGFPVSTAEAYRGVIPDSERESLVKILTTDVADWKIKLHNDFEPSVFKKYPDIKRLKEKLYDYGAVYASMSGSGSSVYGIFEIDFKVNDELKKHLVWEGLTSPTTPGVPG